MTHEFNSFTQIKKKDFTIIQNELIRDPNLSSKAFKLLCIGLSHSGKWKFYKDQIGKCFKEGEYTVDQAMKELRQLGYLHLVAKKNGNKFEGHNWYWFENPVNKDEFKKSLGKGGFLEVQDFSSSENLTGIQEDQLSRKSKELKKKKKCEEIALSKHAFRLSSFLFQKIKEHDPKAKEPNLNTWSKDLDRMHRIDGRSWEEIEDLIKFAQGHEFWRTNCLCPIKLRKQATTLTMQMAKEPSKIQKEASRHEGNKQLAFDKWGYLGIQKIRFTNDGVSIKAYGEIIKIRYTEQGFINQVESALRKGDLL